MTQLIDIHSHNNSINRSIKIINYRVGVDLYALNTQQYYSVGLHPWDIDLDRANIDIALVNELCNLPNVICVGETGIDKTIETDISAQNIYFEKQLQLAEKLQKPVIIHCVKAYNEIIERVKSFSQPIVFHGFNRNLQLAMSIINSGGLVSFGSAVIINKKLQHVLKELPEDSFFLETDDSNIQIEEVYKIVSSVLNISITDLQQQQYRLFNKVFYNEFGR